MFPQKYVRSNKEGVERYYTTKIIVTYQMTTRKLCSSPYNSEYLDSKSFGCSLRSVI